MTYTTKKYYEADKQYYKDRARERTKRLRILVDSAKNIPCMDCGIKYPSYVMDFDHRENKIENVSGMVSRGVAVSKILEEISKCDIVCANCHRVRTHG